MSNNLHLHFEYSTKCELQITFKTFSQFSVVNEVIKILTESYKTQLWRQHTPYIALTFLSFIFFLPGGVLLLLLFLTGRKKNVIFSSQNTPSSSASLHLGIYAYVATAIRICTAMETQGICATV